LDRLRPAWEARLEAGDGQKVRQEAEALLNRPDMVVRETSYTDQHAKVGVLSVAARGAVLEGDWQGAVSLLAQAASTAKSNYAAASVLLLSLRGQHETKITEWKDLMVPREEQLRWLKEQPGLRSEQIAQFEETDRFLQEHQNAIESSEQSIKVIDGNLSTLKAEEEVNSRSLEEWNGFLARERAEIQELGSEQRYVAEKLAQVMGSDRMSRFERVSFARRLQRLDPANAAAKGFLDSLLGTKKTEPVAPVKKAQVPAKVPAKPAPKKRPAPAKAKPAPAKPAPTNAPADGGGQAGAEKADPGKEVPSQVDAAKAEPPAAEPAKTEPTKAEPAATEPAKAEPAKSEPAKTEPPKTDAGKIHLMD
jgi:hypothetical protein